jgi:predicted transposase YbfD/YdcC
LFVGKITGTSCLRGVEALTERSEGYLKKLLPKRVPDTTMYVTASRLRPKEFAEMNEAQIRSWNRSKSLASPFFPCGIVAVDGKSVWRGNVKAHPDCQEKKQGKDGKYYDLRMMRGVLTSAVTKVCVHQSVIPADSNDMGHFKSFYQEFLAKYGPLFGLLTMDAGFASAKNAQLVNETGKGYVIGLKGNQETLLDEAVRLLGSSASPGGAGDWEVRGTTRIRRSLYRSPEMAGYMDFPGLRQVWLVRQEKYRVSTDKRTKGQPICDSEEVEDRYFLTNLTWNYLNPKQILQTVRNHWGIENDHNWTMDTQWLEDSSCWVGKGKGLEVITWIGIMAYNLIQILRQRHFRSNGKRRSFKDWFDIVRRALESEFETESEGYGLLPEGI